MNLDELQDALPDLIRRDDAEVPAMVRALKYAHRRLQRVFDWRAMEQESDVLTYPANGANGVAVPANWKRGRHLWSVVGAARTYILPTAEFPVTERQRLAATAGIPVGLNADLQSWYEKRRRLFLLVVPSADLALVADYYGYLPFFQDDEGQDDPAATDFFADELDEVLLNGAAYYLCKYAFEDERAGEFLKRFETMALEANVEDKKAKLGGTAGVYSPPLPGEARETMRGYQ